MRDFGFMKNEEVWDIADHIEGEGLIQRLDRFKTAITHKGITYVETQIINNDSSDGIVLITDSANPVELTWKKSPNLSGSVWIGQLRVTPNKLYQMVAEYVKKVSFIPIVIGDYIWRDRPLIRLSVQGYNNLRDLGTLFEALDRLLPN